MGLFPTIAAPYYGGTSFSSETTIPDTGHVVTIASVVALITDSQTTVTTDLQSRIGDTIDAVWGEFQDSIGGTVINPLLHDAAFVLPFFGNYRETFTPGQPYRINDITALTYWDGATWQTIPTTDYQGYDAGGFFQLSACNGFTWKRYRATLDVGFTTLPDEVANYIRDKTIERHYDSVAGKDRFGKSQESSSAAVTVATVYDRSKLEARRVALVKKYSGGM